MQQVTSTPLARTRMSGVTVAQQRRAAVPRRAAPRPTQEPPLLAPPPPPQLWRHQRLQQQPGRQLQLGRLQAPHRNPTACSWPWPGH